MKRGIALAVLALLATAAYAYQRAPAPESVRRRPGPSPRTAEERGRLVYERYGCAMCHGADGKGGVANPNAETDGKVPGVIFVAEGYTAPELAKLIRNGAPRIGRADPAGPVPPLRMPGWRDELSAAEVADLVQFLMSLYPKSAGQQWR